MAKYHGAIGFSVQKEVRRGIFVPVIEEHTYYGDITRNISRNENGQYLNDETVFSNIISILGDPFSYENFTRMKYIVFMGEKRKIKSAEILRPRIIITIGGLYIG